MLVLLITALSMLGMRDDTQLRQEYFEEYLEKNRIKATEEFNKTLLPDYLVPIFKVTTRFQGETVINGDVKETIPMSTTMLDIQFLRYTKFFLVFRFFTSTPMVSSSFEMQSFDPFVQIVNNTSVGLSFGLGWFLYDSRTSQKENGLTVSMAFLGFWNIGVANATIDNPIKSNNGGLEINLRVEQYFTRNFALVYGFDFGSGALTYYNQEFNANVTAVDLKYGAVFGFAF